MVAGLLIVCRRPCWGWGVHLPHLVLVGPHLALLRHFWERALCQAGERKLPLRAPLCPVPLELVRLLSCPVTATGWPAPPRALGFEICVVGEPGL